MKQIEKLTQEQERLMYQFRYDWINFVSKVIIVIIIMTIMIII